MWDLPVHGDNRGWFKENWQREKMIAAGLPDFGPVQNNISFNDAVGTTRGIHAEPWDKLVSVATGRIFGAWVDLREGPTFGAVFTTELDPSRAIFVPRGVGNAYQTLEPDTAYTYLVNDHWSPDAAYTFLNLADETAAIAWPIPLDEVEISDKDLAHPRLADVDARCRRGRSSSSAPNGQLGRALRAEFGDAAHVEYADRDELDLAVAGPRDGAPLARLRHDHQRRGLHRGRSRPRRPTAARTPGPRTSPASRRSRAIAPANGITLVHVSSDYVFDGLRASLPSRTTPSRRSACTARPRPPATPSSPALPGTTSCAPPG